MALKLFNTLTGVKETFEPLVPGKVKMYVCGPTVYDYIHIGNARPMIFFDVVRKYLRHLGYDVTFIVNFTDVDDKLIRKAQQMNTSVPQVADMFIRAYLEDAEALRVEPADANPRVTENIPEIIDFIRGLADQGYAYESGGDVYFRTHRFPEYGKLSHQNLQELQYGIRVEVDERKEHPQDFVLWKKAKEGEICWDSPWGEGRPGWHIECSTMAKKYLGETIDIHGGGMDLKFPHHECEVAQSEALHGKPFAKYWMHNGYIHVNNEKMSKSLGNNINVRDLLQEYRPEAVRFFILSTHYRNPLNFSADIMRQAEQSLARLENAVANLEHRMRDGAAAGTEGDTAMKAKIAAILSRFHERMQDDFNTADAVTALFDLAGESNQYVQERQVNSGVLQAFHGAFAEMDSILGILPKRSEELLDEEIERLIRERTEARKNKNWARADEIRDLLQEQGIILEDTPQGVRWRRK
jgi:cysteinyl-tRNA synthetase